MEWFDSVTQGTSNSPVLRVTVSLRDELPVITDCSASVCTALGYDRERLVGAPLTTLTAGGGRHSVTDDARLLLCDADGHLVPVVGAIEPAADGVTATFIPVESRIGPPRDSTTADDARADTDVSDESAASTLDASRRLARYRDRVYRTFAARNVDAETAIERALGLGAEYLGLAVGFVTEIDAETQRISHAVGTDEVIRVGEVCPLNEAYCRRTIERDGLLCVQSASESGAVDERAFDRFGLESYIGQRVVVDGTLHGTVCFADTERRERPFSEAEQLFVESIANMVGAAIEWQRYEAELQRASASVAAERRQLRELFDEGPVLFAQTHVVDGVRVVDSCNERFATRLGYSVDECVGEPLWTFYAADALESGPSDPDHDFTPVTRTLVTRDGDHVETIQQVGRRETADGEKATAGLNVVYLDVTDHRERTEALEREQRKVALALRETRTGIVEWDLRTDELTWDRMLDDSLDVNLETVDDYFACVHPADRNALQETVETMLATGEPAGMQYRLVDADGNSTWVDAHGAVLSEDGEPATMLATVTEVTDQKRREHEALVAMERARLFTENVEEYAFLRIDDSWTVRSWNDGAKRLFGYDAATAEGMPVDELITPVTDDGSPAHTLYRDARRTGTESFTGWLSRADGSEFYADVQYVPTVDGLDGGNQFTAIVHDLTDQYRQRRRTERFVEESVDVVTVISPDGTFEYLSGSVSSVLGHDPSALTGRNAFQLVHPDDRREAMRAFVDSVEHPGQQVSTEFRFKSGSGEWLTIEVRARNLVNDPAVGGILAYARDISEEKRRARRFEAIFNQTYQLTGVLDPDGTWVELNQTALALDDFDREDVVGTPVWETPWWDHDPQCRERLRQAVGLAADGELLRYETEVVGRDGLSTLDFSLKPVHDRHGDVILLVLEGHDVTAAHRQRQHAAVLQRVLRHNMRNDLGKLRGYAELLAADAPDVRERALTAVESVLDKWHSMTERVAEVQRVLREQAHHDQLVDACSLVADVVTATSDRYPDAVVEATLPPSLTAGVPSAVATALTELVDNAVAASDADAPSVEVTLSRPRPRWVDVRVVDDGPGMPASEADVLECGEETPLNHGQGLGLWLVRSITVQAGGWVSADVTDAGTAVTLHLRDASAGPLRRGETPDTDAPPALGMAVDSDRQRTDAP